MFVACNAKANDTIKKTNSPIKFQFSMESALIPSQFEWEIHKWIFVAKDKAIVSLCFHDHDNIHLLFGNGWDIELWFLAYYIIALRLHESASNENICQLSPNNRPIWNSSSWNPICDGICIVRTTRKSRQRDFIYFIWCEQFRTRENNNRKENSVACS